RVAPLHRPPPRLPADARGGRNLRGPGSRGACLQRDPGPRLTCGRALCVGRPSGHAVAMAESPSDFRAPHLRGGDFLGAFAVIESPAGVVRGANRRTIAGRATVVFALLGGQVEPGELLRETLRREVREEVGIEIEDAPEFLFVQE